MGNSATEDIQYSKRMQRPGCLQVCFSRPICIDDMNCLSHPSEQELLSPNHLVEPPCNSVVTDCLHLRQKQITHQIRMEKRRS